MLAIEESLIVKQTDRLEEDYAKQGSSPLMFNKFINKVYSKQEQEFKPYDVKIPKSIPELLAKDFEPARIIKIDKQIVGADGTPLWWDTTEDGICLTGLGYKNGDSRYPSAQMLDDKDIHAVLGGATGHGKSVTLNSVIIGAAKRYAPWELELIMADAKVTEFKKYAQTGLVLPHIRSIAATTDAEYIISVLEAMNKEMENMNAIFGDFGGSIGAARAATGLSFPQRLIVIDEFQVMLLNAQKKREQIMKLFINFAKLGRSTGFHLFLASQEMDGLPKEVTASLGVRMALGCMEDVSNKILGNGEAATNFRAKGRLIVNNNIGAGKSNNVQYRVPFIAPSEFEGSMRELADLGEKFEYKLPYSYYDEKKLFNFEGFKEYIKSKKLKPNRIYLGEPSFVLHNEDGDDLLRIDNTGMDLENIAIWGTSSADVLRHTQLLRTNFELLGNRVIHNVFHADRGFIGRAGFESFVSKRNIIDASNSDDPNYTAHFGSIYRRKLLMEVDDLLFDEDYVMSDVSSEYFYGIFDEGSEFDTELMKQRSLLITRLIQGKVYRQMFAMDGSGDEDTIVRTMTKSIGLMCKVYDCMDQRCTVDHMPPIYNWIIGLDKIIGWGRDGKPAEKARLKKVLQDSFKANVRFIITVNDMEELTEFRTCVRYFILDGITESQSLKVKAEGYPEKIGNQLSVLFDRLRDGNRECLKFKKTILPNEIIA